MDIRICIDVDDLDKALLFYTQGMGLQPGRRFRNDFAEVLGAGAPIDLLCNAAGSTPIKGSPATRSYQRHWTPVHLDFVTDDIEAAVASAVRHGATLEAPITDNAWGRIAGLADPFGHGIDLIEFRGRGYDEIFHPH